MPSVNSKFAQVSTHSRRQNLITGENEEIDRNGWNGPEWVSRGGVNCEVWSNEAISMKMVLHGSVGVSASRFISQELI